MAMARLWVLLPLALAFPTPPEQTQEQVEIFEKAKARAKAASEAATPQVLAFFDGTLFREMLKDCCPAVAHLPASELLKRYRAEAQVAELAHALPSDNSGQRTPSADVTISELGNMSWFPNEYQVNLMSGKNSSSRGEDISDDAMKEIFGCKAFAGAVPTWSEASSRLIYVAHNMRRLDTGSEPHFGDFTVIFNSSRMKDSVLIAPYDTGMYTMNCLHPGLHPGSQTKTQSSSGQPGPPGPPMADLNCTAWSKDHKVDLPVGTLDYLDHLILPNLWSAINTTVSNQTVLDAARVLFSRSGISGIDYEDVPAMKESERNDYFESDILANPPVPAAVKLGIGSFATLFGTEEGRQLQTMALRYKWPLFWAYGEGTQTGPPPPQSQKVKSQKLNRRMADPSNIVKTTNASVSSSAAKQFENVWQEAVEARASRQVTDEDLLQWWNSLDQELRVAPVSASSCAQPHHCVGVDIAKKDCICKVQDEIFMV
ncbi:unnamed protein product [Durusdinium trenchii]|uniref:Phospholipase B-like n=1 Tax=Durusdinium trenchii TaxID=1381693 RepID=A0ABP0P4X7_9DINO